jgi:hypothetical protein
LREDVLLSARQPDYGTSHQIPSLVNNPQTAPGQ